MRSLIKRGHKIAWLYITQDSGASPELTHSRSRSVVAAICGETMAGRPRRGRGGSGGGSRSPRAGGSLHIDGCSGRRAGEAPSGGAASTIEDSESSRHSDVCVFLSAFPSRCLSGLIGLRTVRDQSLWSHSVLIKRFYFRV